MEDSVIAPWERWKVPTGFDYPETITPGDRHPSSMKRPCEWGCLQCRYLIGVPQISCLGWCHLKKRKTSVTLAQIEELSSSKQNNWCFKAAIDNQSSRYFQIRLSRKKPKFTKYHHPQPSYYIFTDLGNKICLLVIIWAIRRYKNITHFHGALFIWLVIISVCFEEFVIQ